MIDTITVLKWKKSGGIRHIESPLKELKAIQRWVLRYILDKLSPSSYAKGFVRKNLFLTMLNRMKEINMY
jgi:hypothetical protein